MPATRKLFQASSPKRAAPGRPGSRQREPAEQQHGQREADHDRRDADERRASMPRQPDSVGCGGGCGLRMRLPPAARAAPRDQRSSSTAPMTNASSAADSCAAATLVAEREPGAVDAGGERVDGEIGDGAVVGERLHQRQRDAAGDGRARERQVDAPERARARRGPACARLRSATAGRSRNAVRASR